MKRFFKIFVAFMGILAIVLLALYFYVVNNAERLIKDFVSRQSHGKLSIEIKRIDFHPRKLYLSVKGAHFYSNDSLHETTTYDIKASSLVLQLSALKPLIFERKFFLDTIVCMRPQVTVTRWKELPKENFSLPGQMGLAYDKLNNLLNTFNIKYCLIDSGSFTLDNKVQKNSKPITITDYYLRVDNLKLDSSSRLDHRYLFTDRIKFYSSHQDIVFGNGNRGIKYGHLRINSLKQSIEIDSCYIYQKKEGTSFNEYGIFFDTLRLTNADFNKLTRQSLVKADSAICINPDIRIKIELPEKQHEKMLKKRQILSKDSMELTVKRLLGDLEVKYVGVLNASILLQTKLANEITSYSTKRNNFIIEDVSIVKDTSVPLKAGSFYVAMEQYQTFNHDSTYSISFDSILFRNDKVNLSRFVIAPTHKNKDFNDRKMISMSYLQITKLSWLDLIMNKKIVAAEVTLVKPSIIINAPSKKRPGNLVQGSLFSILHGVTDRIKVGRLKIADASVDFSTASNNHLKLEKVNFEIDVNDLLRSENINELEGAINNVSFAGGTYDRDGNSVKLSNGFINGGAQSIFISAANVFTRMGRFSIVLKNIKLNRFKQAEDNVFHVGEIGWQKADIIIHPSAKKANSFAGKKITVDTAFKVVLGKLDGRNTNVIVKSENVNASVKFDWISAGQINWDGINKPEIKELQLKGNTVKLGNKKLSLDVGEFKIVDKQLSYLHQLNILSVGVKDSVVIKNNTLEFTPDISSIIAGEPVIKDVIVHNPLIKIIDAGKSEFVESNSKKGRLPKLDINQISIINPVITGMPDKKINVADQKSNWYVTGIRSNNNQLTIKGIKSTITGFTARSKKMTLSVADKGKLTLDVSNIKFVPASASASAAWAATLNDASFRNVELTIQKNDSSKNLVDLQSLDIENLTIKSGDTINADQLLAGNKNFRLRNGSLNLNSPKSILQLSGLQYNHKQQTVWLDSMAYRPALDVDSFNKVNGVAKDYLQFKTGHTTITGVSPELILSDTVFVAQKIETTNPILQVYKDKTLPAEANVYKPLPTRKLEQIGKKIKIDSVQLNNADITYEEVNEKTLLHGIVHFTHTDGLLEDIKTFDYLPNDSLRLFASSTLLDSIKLRLRFHESYADTLHGFLLGVRLSPFNMIALNPILQPLVSAKINRGWLDTMRMFAIGREYIAHGKMKMYYNNLNASYLNKGSEDVKTFKTKLITFLANSLIIRKKNQQGIAQVYAARIQEKSVFNYWLKMLASGAISSTGVKSNKKQQKKYNKSVKRLGVPEIPEIEL